MRIGQTSNHAVVFDVSINYSDQWLGGYERLTVLPGPLFSTIFQVRLKQDTQTPESENSLKRPPLAPRNRTITASVNLPSRPCESS